LIFLERIFLTGFSGFDAAGFSPLLGQAIGVSSGMAPSDLSSSQLSQLIHLIKQKEALQSQIAKINEELSSLETNEPDQPKKARRGRGRAHRAKTSDAILKELAKAGKAGMSVKDIAAATGAKAPSIAVWLYTAGKKVKGLRKIARGRFGYKTAA
jgi:predicted Rossmann fold nucleotide-binding protein DprA/Smf involved in DNA uptake